MNAFVRQLVGNVIEGRLTERALVNLLNEVHDLVTSEHALRSAEQWIFDVSGVWPMEELPGFEGDKIPRWLEHRFARYQSWNGWRAMPTCKFVASPAACPQAPR